MYGTFAAFLGVAWAMRPVFYVIEVMKRHHRIDWMRLIAEFQLAVVLLACGIAIVRTPSPPGADANEALVVWSYESFARLVRIIVFASASLTLLAAHSLYENIVRILQTGAPGGH